jgi:hypothetical protein
LNLVQRTDQSDKIQKELAEHSRHPVGKVVTITQSSSTTSPLSSRSMAAVLRRRTSFRLLVVSVGGGNQPDQQRKIPDAKGPKVTPVCQQTAQRNDCGEIKDLSESCSISAEFLSRPVRGAAARISGGCEGEGSACRHGRWHTVLSRWPA